MKQKMYSFKQLFYSLIFFFGLGPFLLLGVYVFGSFMSLLLTIINWVFLNLGNSIYLKR